MAPVGRPPLGYEWKDGFGWIRTATGEPFSQGAYRAELRRRQRELEKRRYWDEHTGTRARRRQRTLKEAEARAAARPGKPRQLTLVEVGQVRKSAGPIISADTVTPGCETDGPVLHGQAQGTVAHVSAACHGFSTNKK